MKTIKEGFEIIDKCPFCKTPSTSASRSKDIYGSFISEAGGGSEYVHPSFQIVICGKCSLAYKSLVPSTKILYEYYADLDTAYEDLNYTFPTDRVIIDYFDVNTKGMKVLDFGCGSGRLLSRLNKDVKKYGVEINTQAIQSSLSKGIQIIDEKDLSGGYEYFFDFIILTDVYEHIIELNKNINKFISLLKTGGKIIIATGNYESIKDRKNIGHHWYFQIFSHLQMASVSHMQYFESAFNLKIDFLKEVSHYDTSFSIKIRKFLTDSAFKLYQSSGSLGRRFFNFSKLKGITKWKYPPYTLYSKDHIVCVLQKQ